MYISYFCRYCSTMIGRVDQKNVSPTQLGVDSLSARDKEKMIIHQDNGDIHIQTICESCEASLQQHPHYYELDNFLQ